MRYTVTKHPYATRLSVYKFAVMFGDTLVEGFGTKAAALAEAARLNRFEFGAL
jgi:hypothetical protein